MFKGEVMNKIGLAGKIAIGILAALILMATAHMVINHIDPVEMIRKLHGA